jgi:hypothetical protein
MKTNRLLAVFALLAGCGGTEIDLPSQESQQLDSDGPRHIHWQRGFAHHQGGGGNLIDHGGPVLAADSTYAIWWGATTAWPSDTQSSIDALFNGFNGTSFLGVANQYMRGGTATSSFVGNFFDSSSPPSRSPSNTTLANEVCAVLNTNGVTPSSNAIYFIYTSNFPSRVNFCAFHTSGTCNGVTIQFAYMPNTTGVAGCDPGNQLTCNSLSQGTRSLANVTSHEYMEAITDPDLNAWFDQSGQEIGDKCAWQFQSCVTLTNGSWQLQEEWSNATSGCVQQ